MSNVGRHSLVRTSHARTTRPSHVENPHRAVPDLPLGNLQQDSIDRVVGVQDILPGSLAIGKYASSIRPVAIVDALPTLPSDDYPINSYVVLTTTNRLYKNIADAWVLGVNGADIVADSITAGQIAAGAISATELAVGAWNQGNLLKNGDFEDPTGSETYGTAGTEVPGWVLRGASQYKQGSTAFAISGTHVLMIQGTDGVTANPGCMQTVSVIPGRTYRLSGWMWMTTTGSSIPYWLRANTTDETGAVVSFSVISLTGSATGATYYEGYYTVPSDGTVSGLRIDCIYNGTPNVAQQQFYEDVMLELVGTNIKNSSAEVIIDSNGVTILNGKLSIADDTGASVMSASGFGGSWSDFVRTGLYNGGFESNTAGTNIAMGRTSKVPYWTLAKVGGTGSVDSSVGQVNFNIPTSGDQYTITSDRVRCSESQQYSVVTVERNSGASVNTIRRIIKLVFWTAATGGSSSTVTLQTDDLGQTALWGVGKTTALRGGSGYKYVQVLIDVAWQSETSGTPNYQLSDVSLVAMPYLDNTDIVVQDLNARTANAYSIITMPFAWTGTLPGTGTQDMFAVDDAMGVAYHRNPWAGYAVGISVGVATARTAGTLTAQVRNASDGTTLSTPAAVLDGTNTTWNYNTVTLAAATAVPSFKALTIRLTTSGWTPTANSVVGLIYIAVPTMWL